MYSVCSIRKYWWESMKSVRSIRVFMELHKSNSKTACVLLGCLV